MEVITFNSRFKLWIATVITTVFCLTSSREPNQLRKR
jgi:hypothetical protein